MELVGKLSPRAIGWDRGAIAATMTNPDGTPKANVKTPLGRFAGIVSGLKQTVNNDTGDIQTGLKGNFRAVSTKNIFEEQRDDKGNVVTDKDGNKVLVDTGKPIAVTSGVCYLPGGIQEMVEGALASAKEKDPKATVSFVLDLVAITSTNKAGYTFTANNIVEAAATDPLQALLEQADATLAALPAPDAKVKTEEKETVKA